MPSAAQTMPNFVGSIINVHYQVEVLLGSGTYGAVYKARDLREPVPTYRAIKIMRLAGREPRELKIISREIELHGAISNHPGVVTMYEAFQNDEYVFVVLELCSGGNLFKYICDDSSFACDEERLRRTFLEIVDAVQACHDAGIAHRDLKPENILTGPEGEGIYLADFGLSTTRCEVDEHGCGTEIYMSPGKCPFCCFSSSSFSLMFNFSECAGAFVPQLPYSSHTSDIWAVGVILVNMIAGRNPWCSADPSDTGFLAFMHDPVGYFQHVLGFSPGAAELVAHTLCIDPQNRITLRELREGVLALDTFTQPKDQPRQLYAWSAVSSANGTYLGHMFIPAVPAEDYPSSESDVSSESSCTSSLSSASSTSSLGPEDDITGYYSSYEFAMAYGFPESEVRAEQPPVQAKATPPPVDWQSGSTAKLLMALHRRAAVPY